MFDMFSIRLVVLQKPYCSLTHDIYCITGKRHPTDRYVFSFAWTGALLITTN